ncbi:MAG: UDP-N-acetylmuramoyl-L-alanyl-D-glutamate--2,6-diaminopimelate ligase [Deltaproteobacteria bacterium]|nr:MAG: UDP-N-acetylmuramoyl-L-alanyl-D-glutamate--2,6-diaminopimelate ligase [Deltaproteobacteria bacterium]PIE72967.1 MAG: UDP-N-acetylmuramoyl-L-alanyl-D-glutamate--2,6-diaminopimelate ligase [Deltaproteobacteria bacterium]
MSNFNRHIALAKLLKGLTYSLGPKSSPVELASLFVSDVVADSRQVRQASLFVALEGETVDGHDFIAQAEAAGAGAVVCNAGKADVLRESFPSLCIISVADTAETYAGICANLFAHPAEHLKLVGITGTNGKTTVTYIVEDILIAAGKNVGVIGTVNNRYTTEQTGRVLLPASLTTPQPYELQALLSEMVEAGVEYLVMEVSSHALVQNRVGGLRYDAAALTNISRDHLDYHGDMEAYFSAKLLLFSKYLNEDGRIVLPDILEGEEDCRKALDAFCQSRESQIIYWGESEKADLQLVSHTSDVDSTRLDLLVEGRSLQVRAKLAGAFNRANLLTAIGLAKALGISTEAIVQGLSQTEGAPGRLERIRVDQWNPRCPRVFVDYAHTPDALEKVLSTVRTLPHRNVFAVFGCGGDRDPGKRALMGGVGARLADVGIITSDNPRTEDPGTIIAQILDGVREEEVPVYDRPWLTERSDLERGCLIIEDRREAIFCAIRSAGPEDIVVIAGKGHEAYQIRGRDKIFFADNKEAQDALFSWTPQIVADATRGRIISGAANKDRLLGTVITDSRIKSRNGVFVALRGEKKDGHTFALQAAASGASCLVVERLLAGLDEDVVQIVVDDTTKALGDLAAYRRRAFQGETGPQIIGITGSCGKTTVKEMSAAIFTARYPPGPDYPANSVLKTSGNFNNSIGLPLSLLPLGVHHRAVILEMGMNAPGEITALAAIADPDISCITNISGGHLAGLGSIEGVVAAKEEIFAATKASGVLVVNLDDPRVAGLAGKYPQKKITFGIKCHLQGLQADIWADDVCYRDDGSSQFMLHYRNNAERIALFLPGEHNVLNALCAAAIAIAAGCSMAEVADGLSNVRAIGKRMETILSRSGFTIFNDTYNANPASMEAGLRTLASFACRRRLAVLGDMLELGDSAPKAHYTIGALVARLGVDMLICYGEWAVDMMKGFNAEKTNGSCSVATTKDEIVSRLAEMIEKKELGTGDALLVKASRGLQFETIVKVME